MRKLIRATALSCALLAFASVPAAQAFTGSLTGGGSLSDSLGASQDSDPVLTEDELAAERERAVLRELNAERSRLGASPVVSGVAVDAALRTRMADMFRSAYTYDLDKIPLSIGADDGMVGAFACTESSTFDAASVIAALKLNRDKAFPHTPLDGVYTSSVGDLFSDDLRVVDVVHHADAESGRACVLISGEQEATEE